MIALHVQRQLRDENECRVEQRNFTCEEISKKQNLPGEIQNTTELDCAHWMIVEFVQASSAM